MGFGEIIVIVLVGLIVLGPERLPTVARAIGRTFAFLSKGANSLQQQFDEQMKLDKLQQNIASAEQAALEVQQEIQSAVRQDHV